MSGWQTRDPAQVPLAQILDVDIEADVTSSAEVALVENPAWTSSSPAGTPRWVRGTAPSGVAVVDQLLLRSPDGTVWQFTVDNTGELSSSELSLTSLTDVTVDNPQDGDELAYDNGQWSNHAD